MSETEKSLWNICLEVIPFNKVGDSRTILSGITEKNHRFFLMELMLEVSQNDLSKAKSYLKKQQIPLIDVLHLMNKHYLGLKEIHGLITQKELIKKMKNWPKETGSKKGNEKKAIAAQKRQLKIEQYISTHPKTNRQQIKDALRLKVDLKTIGRDITKIKTDKR